VKILLVCPERLPPERYGGIERVVWWLGRALHGLGHEVRFLARGTASNGFSTTVPWRDGVPPEQQVDDWPDVVHFHFPFRGTLARPHLSTIHGNAPAGEALPRDSVFVSRSHAAHHGAECFVHNGIGLEDYDAPLVAAKEGYAHFLGKAAWRVKNVRGAIRVARRAGLPLRVLGGTRLNFGMGFRFTPWPSVRFHGMVGQAEKLRWIPRSRGLVFPVLWHEPFGLAVVESLWLGAPVFGTPYGALPELVPSEVGVLAASEGALAAALREAGAFSPQRCRDWAAAHFDARTMARAYLRLYERVAAGEPLHPRPPAALPIPFRGLPMSA
jgi:glycosyltransferase involved in cell wall biosynthesis